MKKFLVIGNPIKHSLSPRLHNYWLQKNNIQGIYHKKLIQEQEIESLFKSNSDICGINVTVPFKKSVINYCNKLSDLALKTQSINTISFQKREIVGDNTDIYGFEQSLKITKFNGTNKTALILGAGGVVPSIVIGLNNLGVKNIIITNRTRNKSEILAKRFNLEVIDWGSIVNFDIVINCTSVGLKENDNLNLDFSNITNKIFYDTIYNSKTRFLIDAKNSGNEIIDGKMMFLYQAQKSFEIWHGIQPEVNEGLNSIFYD